MPPKLTSAEINYLVALYGDLPFSARKRLFGRSSMPVRLASQVMQDGHDFVQLLRDRAGEPQGGRPRRRRPFPYAGAGHPEKRTGEARKPATPPSSANPTPEEPTS